MYVNLDFVKEDGIGSIALLCGQRVGCISENSYFVKEWIGEKRSKSLLPKDDDIRKSYLESDDIDKQRARYNEGYRTLKKWLETWFVKFESVFINDHYLGDKLYEISEKASKKWELLFNHYDWFKKNPRFHGIWVHYTHGASWIIMGELNNPIMFCIIDDILDYNDEDFIEWFEDYHKDFIEKWSNPWTNRKHNIELIERLMKANKYGERKDPSEDTLDEKFERYYIEISDKRKVHLDIEVCDAIGINDIGLPMPESHREILKKMHEIATDTMKETK